MLCYMCSKILKELVARLFCSVDAIATMHFSKNPEDHCRIDKITLMVSMSIII